MDIADLILEDHHRQRRAFALLDEADPSDMSQLAAIWGDLADFLEVHAAAEELVLYPVVLQVSDPDASETKDAIGDHNDLRDSIAAAALREVGSDGWWEAVGAARAANTEHMGEEEDEVLAHFRQSSEPALRSELGIAFEAAKSARKSAQLDLADKDPKQYVADHT